MQRCIVILGMHRSGTSCLAGSVEEAGVFLGSVSRKNPHNPRGNCENIKIMGLNEGLLVSNGGSWHSPPETIFWYRRHKFLRDNIIEDYKNANVWGFKDPRTLFTLEGWLDALHNISFVGTYRNPALVALSLQKRNKFSIEQGLNLWVRYNKKLLMYHKKFGFPIISFDIDGDTYKKKLVLLLSRLGLSLDPEKTGFFADGLRCIEVKDDVPLPKEVLDLYEKLKEISL